VDVSLSPLLPIILGFIFSFKDEVSPTVPVYNLDYAPISAGPFHDAGQEALKITACHNALWSPVFFMTNDRYVFLALHLLLHVLPGMLFDTILILSRAPTKVR